MPGESREWLERDTADRSGMDSYTGFQTVTKPQRAVVVGGGFIGLEMAENLIHRGLEVTLIERMIRLCPRSTRKWRAASNAIWSSTASSSSSMTAWLDSSNLTDGSLEVLTSSGKDLPADIVILAIGVRPETALAKDGWPRDRPTRRHPRGRADAHERPGYLRRRRCGRGQGLRHRPMDSGGAGGAGQPAGPHRGRCDCRARLPLPRHAGHFDLPDFRRRDRHHRR